MRAVVIGAGIVGLSCAWKLIRAGHQVTVIDPAPGTGSTQAAAGMLAPISETVHTEQHMLAVGLESLAAYPRFVADLAADTGQKLGLRETGTVLVAVTADDMAALEDVAQLHAQCGQPTQRLTPSALTALEPGVSPSIRGGFHIPADQQIDVPHLWSALMAAVSSGGTVVRLRVDSVQDLPKGGHLVLLGHDQEPEPAGTIQQAVPAEVVIVAAGTATADILPEHRNVLPTRPISGATLELSPRSAGITPLAMTVRAVVQSRAVYLVPTAQSQVIVGASSVERGFDPAVTLSDVHDLTRAAVQVSPDVAELEFVRIRQGFRPGTADNAPIIGYVRPGVLVATGHYRHGVLLAPWTADLVSGLVDNPTQNSGFSPDRFAR